jgi:pyruvate,water dikinase
VSENILWFSGLGMNDVGRVGGKNASLGEMISNLSSAGISVPDGFATTADAFREFVQYQDLDKQIYSILDQLDADDITELGNAGKTIRDMVVNHPLPESLESGIRQAYQELTGDANSDVAVRSSATAEDLPDASFAGQQETFLNIRGIENVLKCIKEVFASLFNDRAIAYRVHQGFDHAEVALSAGVQRMIRSDQGCSGVMFTIDTESGFNDVVLITSSWGLGECIVQGSVNPDEFYVYKQALARERPAILRRSRGSKNIKMVYADQEADQAVEIVAVPQELQLRFSLTDAEVTALAGMAVTIENHYGRPMDIEWGKDGSSGEIYILQARPETVESRSSSNSLERYILKQRDEILVEGRSIGQRIGAGKVKLVPGVEHLDKVKDGDVLVTDMTDPDWEPVMKRASAIVTNRGGRTCHAAIIARELGVPAVVGCGNATEILQDEMPVTVSCAEGDTGYVYTGNLGYEIVTTNLDEMPDIPFQICMNVGNPERAFSLSRIPNSGVGLARLEFIINNTIGVHPQALFELDCMPEDIRVRIMEKMAGYSDPVSFYVEKLVEGIASLGAAFYPKPVIVRLSDFKSNEYANLIGGEKFEPEEENPMLGYRGVSRYISDEFRRCFDLECDALKFVRDEMGLDNIQIMVPFVRTLDQASDVIRLLDANGLSRGKNGLRIIMMCEIPSNALLADQFLEYFDGFSIGSNDLTQFTLGLDRDSGVIAHLFDERDPAVKKLMSLAIQSCRKAGKYVGICGQGPSDYPDLAQWLMKQGIHSVSLNPDTVINTWMFLADSKSEC